MQLLVCKGEDTQWFSLLSPHPATVSQSIWTKSLNEVHATPIPTKLSTLWKACDVTWPEKCKQTSAESSISSVPFVLNIYKKWNIWKLFFRTRNFSWTYKELWSVIIFVDEVFGCSRRYWRSVSYLPVIGSSSTYGPKYF